MIVLLSWADECAKEPGLWLDANGSLYFPKLTGNMVRTLNEARTRARIPVKFAHGHICVYG